jgi:hypothetical protein
MELATRGAFRLRPARLFRRPMPEWSLDGAELSESVGWV